MNYLKTVLSLTLLVHATAFAQQICDEPKLKACEENASAEISSWQSTLDYWVNTFDGIDYKITQCRNTVSNLRERSSRYRDDYLKYGAELNQIDRQNKVLKEFKSRQESTIRLFAQFQQKMTSVLSSMIGALRNDVGSNTNEIAALLTAEEYTDTSNYSQAELNAHTYVISVLREIKIILNNAGNDRKSTIDKIALSLYGPPSTNTIERFNPITLAVIRVSQNSASMNTSTSALFGQISYQIQDTLNWVSLKVSELDAQYNQTLKSLNSSSVNRLNTELQISSQEKSCDELDKVRSNAPKSIPICQMQLRMSKGALQGCRAQFCRWPPDKSDRHDGSDHPERPDRS